MPRRGKRASSLGTWVLCFSVCLIAGANHEANDCHSVDGGQHTCTLAQRKSAWKWDPESRNHRCNIERFSIAQINREFGPQGLPPLYEKPIVVFGGDPLRNRKFIELCDPSKIASSTMPRGFLVTLSSSNTFSQHRRTVSLQHYLDEILTQVEVLPDQLSNETWYLFGETYSDEWMENLLQYYEKPPCVACVRDDLVALAFGIGNRGSGVQWHVHGPGFSEAIWGRKHWVLYPNRPENFSPNETSRHWMENKYTALSDQELPMECTLSAGEMIYFPNGWYHATINLDPYTAFVSTFTQEHMFTKTGGDGDQDEEAAVMELH